MRNGAPLQPQQQQLNESIDRTRALMHQFEQAPNKEQMLMSMIQSNPQLGSLATMLHNGNSLEGIAKAMAMNGGYDLNQIINRLTGGTY